MTDDTTILPPPLTLEIASQELTIKMTYGLEMDIRRMLPDIPSAIQLVSSDPFTQDYIIRRVLTPVKKMVTDMDDLIPVEDVEISADERENIIHWALEHAVHFFMVRAGSIKKLGDKYQIAPPVPSINGSEA